MLNINSNTPIVLDTNILLNNPTIMYELDSDVIVPLTVVSELDKQKGQNDKPNLKYMARTAIREIKKAVSENVVSIYKPETINPKHMEFLSTYNVNDDLILATVLELNEKTGIEHILMTNDFGMYIKATGLKIRVEEYQIEKVINNDYKGFVNVNVDYETMIKFFSVKTQILQSELSDVIINSVDQLINNAFYEITCDSNDKMKKLFFYNGTSGLFETVKERTDFKMFGGIMPKNKEQLYYAHLLENRDLTCVQVKGESGSGKTLISLSWAFNAIESGKYKKLIYLKTMDPVSGHDIGYVPGSKHDKIDIYMSPLYDSLERMTGWKKDECRLHIAMMEQMGKFETETIAHIRGRSFDDTILIVDESENLDIPTLRTILTRAGNNSKVLILSDDMQIDAKHLTALTNGTAIMKDRLVGQKLYGFIELQSAVRSELVTMINRLMI